MIATKFLFSRGVTLWGCLRSLAVWILLTTWFSIFGGSTHPYYQRRMPVPQKESDFASDTYHMDFASTNVHVSPYPAGPIDVSTYSSRFDARAAAAVSDCVGTHFNTRIFPLVTWRPYLIPTSIAPFHIDENGVVSDKPGENLTSDFDLLEMKWYGDRAPTIYIPTVKCLAALAYLDYFPNSAVTYLRGLVSGAILASSPGWCGTFGPGVDTALDLAVGSPAEGNYDITQMHLLEIAYRYYDELTPAARELLITVLLATGRIHRPYLDDIVTSGGPPDDWARAGRYDPLGGGRIGETENHILMIHTARYLSNQLLYQRDHDPNHDNRRNGGDGAPSCTDLMLALLRNILRDDFSEYNAKPYQNETRSALLNLCSYAYDHEVRLAARMVLDYISARIAVSSSDLRRMVPFRRRNESEHSRNAQLPGGFMDVGLLDWNIGADPMVEHFAIQAGNLRALEHAGSGWSWGLGGNGGDATMEALSDYRLPPSIHDLFVNDLHRRFFQRLHRTARWEEAEGSRNCDNMEIYAGSPSYLISAGGKPATYALDPGPAGVLAPSGQAQQLGVAVTTSIMLTSEFTLGAFEDARNLIQFSTFSDRPDRVENYGVAPDFAFGRQIYLPSWVPKINDREFLFINRKYPGQNIPGCYLAIFKDGNLGCLEAFDTWMQPGLSFEDFKTNVLQRNPNFRLATNTELLYTTQNGTRVHFIMENPFNLTDGFSDRVTKIEYGNDPWSNQGDAGNVTDKFLNGTIMNSPAEAVVEISNPFLGTKIVLDMQDQWHPRRLSETGELEEGGGNHEVWVDFDWIGPMEGDFYRPFNTLAGALAAVADGGTIKIMPGVTHEKPFVKKGVKLVAPIGGVRIGIL